MNDNSEDIGFPVPEDEERRLASLKSYNILDTMPEEDYNAITRLASYICQVPISLVSLIDTNRQWFKSKVGLEANQTPRNISFCRYAILSEEVMEIPNALEDERFATNPLVTADPHIRFYAGAPLIMPDGYKLGTLCVIDQVPRKLTPEQKDALRTLAKEVVAQLVLRKQKMILEREKELIERSLRIKEQFMANMSHEIRTPMNGIMGLTNLLLDTPLNQEQKDYLHYIQTCTDNLLVIVNDILDFSKIESGKIKFESIPFDIGAIFNSMAALFRSKVEEKGLQFQVSISEQIPARLMGDPYRLTQILNNLLGNAVKFTENGTVTLAVELAGQAEGNSPALLFTVQDTGIGIPAEKYNSIFESFTQADNDTTRKYGGTGLGLAITKSLVEQQGGQIWVNSKMGVGSVFQFKLPFIADVMPHADETATPAPVQEAPQTKKIRVLIAEDNAVNQLIASRIIKDHGFEGVVAEDGKKAITQLEQHDFDIVLMDIQMPEMDGYQAIKFIRQNMPRQKSIPIIALTAHAVKDEIEKCFFAGANDYLAKPFTSAALIKKIENWTTPAENTGN